MCVDVDKYFFIIFNDISCRFGYKIVLLHLFRLFCCFVYFKDVVSCFKLCLFAHRLFDKSD